MTCTRGHRAAEAIAEMELVVAELADRGVTAAELAKAKNLTETDFWAQMIDADGKAESLGHHETALGDFRSLAELGRRLAAVTIEDIVRVVRTYLVPDARTTIIAEPDGTDPDDDDEDGDDEDDEDDEADATDARAEAVA